MPFPCSTPTPPPLSARLPRGAVAAVLALACGMVCAAAPSPAAAAAPAAAGTAVSNNPGTAGTPPFPTGQGPGYHSPLSPIKPLEEKDGIVSWKLLSSVKTRQVQNRLEPIFSDTVKALNQQTVKVQGFMMPLEAGLKQRHFLLSAVPTTCSFCVPAGPEGLIEVRSRKPVAYGLEPVVVEGKLQVLSNDAMGLYYRIEDANPAP